MTTLIQRSFAGGEIAPSLYARVDTTKYATGARTIKNFYVMRHGGVATRAGTSIVGEVKDSSKTIGFIPFVFNSDQTYVLEFGDQYMRVHRDGAQVTLTAQSITGATNANPCVVTYSGSDTYANGDEVYIEGIVGAIGAYLNGRNFKIANVDTTANTFSLKYMDGTAVNSTTFGAYTSGGTVAEIYEISTPYLEEDLSTINFVQSADVITLVHSRYQPRDLARTGHTSWTLTEITFAPSIAAPANPTNDGAAGSTYVWVITAIDAETGEESLASTQTSGDTDPSASIVDIGWDSVTGANEYNVYQVLSGVAGFVGTAIGTTFRHYQTEPDTSDTPPTARNPFDLETAKTITAITAANPAVVTTSAAHGYSTDDLVKIAAVVGMTQVNGIHFLVTVITSTTFSLRTMVGVAVDSSAYTAYVSGGTVRRAHNYPSTVAYIQQRRMFANTIGDPEKCFGSRTSHFSNFTVSSPTQDDDAVTFTMAGRQVNAVRHLLDIGRLITFTSGGEWTIEGDQSGIIRPGDVNPKQHSYNGASPVPPIVIGGNALYIQARGTIVRDLTFDFQVDGYRGNDLTIFSAHLFDGYTILGWAFQQIPHSIVWVVRSDGALLGLTYVREHEMCAWHQHEFDGTVENVCVVPEGDEDAVYLCVKRTIDGDTKRYIERMNSRRIDDVVDFVGMDCTLSYDGRNATASHTMTLSGGTTWAYDETITLTSSASFFTAADVGNAIHLTGSDGSVIRFTIAGFTGVTIVTGKPHMTVPVAMRSTAISDWARAVDELTGLWHIEGKDVSVFADGFVVASPNNDSYDVLTVTNGSITLDRPYGVIHVGLPYLCDLETLNIDSNQSETVADKHMIVTKVNIHVESSRGIWVGGEPPEDDDDDPLEGLTEVKVRDDEDYSDPVALSTEVVDVNIMGVWNSNGRVFIRQVDPIPASILAVLPAGLAPFAG